MQNKTATDFDEIVSAIARGDGNQHYENIVNAIMSADDREYERLYRVYSDLVDAIDRWRNAHKFISDVRFERTKRGK